MRFTERTRLRHRSRPSKLDGTLGHGAADRSLGISVSERIRIGRDDDARGPEAVARTILTRGAPFARLGRPALVNGAPGVLVGPLEAPISVVAFTVARGRIASVDVIASPTIGH